MAMTRSLFGKVLRRSSIPRLPSPAASSSSSPFASRSLEGAMETPIPSAYSAAAAPARSFPARPGLSPPVGLRSSYQRSSGSNRQLHTKEDIKDKVTDDGMLVKLIKRFLLKIGHPSQLTGPALQEWARNHKGWKDTNPTKPMLALFTGLLVIVWVTDEWQRIKATGGLTGGRDRNAQDKD